MINSGTLLISAAWSVIVIIIIHNSQDTDDDLFLTAGGPACAVVAFFAFLVGVSLVLLALVADRFPRASRIGVAVATKLSRYLVGPGW
ncbi:hypothetical protein HU200_059185 [Digitaria exilis]|uniref:Uncharacterized protein n=1 Tax=Digitaria exilis TaxID=1010633 RepID=A0A835AIM1_9POAL|nr:hypothetical protein HU200_059185 [Digitaria exilis]